jgi:hypothetical protein
LSVSDMNTFLKLHAGLAKSDRLKKMVHGKI